MTCKIEDCIGSVRSKGLCSTHYHRSFAVESPDAHKKYGKPQQVFETIEPHDTDCVIWPCSRTTAGYGQMWRDGSRQYVHRLVCEKFNGPIPAEKPWALHKCGMGHKGCVNPKHLYWGSPKENTADKIRHAQMV